MLPSLGGYCDYAGKGVSKVRPHITCVLCPMSPWGTLSFNPHPLCLCLAWARECPAPSGFQSLDPTNFTPPGMGEGQLSFLGWFSGQGGLREPREPRVSLTGPGRLLALGSLWRADPPLDMPFPRQGAQEGMRAPQHPRGFVQSTPPLETRLGVGDVLCVEVGNRQPLAAPTPCPDPIRGQAGKF